MNDGVRFFILTEGEEISLNNLKNQKRAFLTGNSEMLFCIKKWSG